MQCIANCRWAISTWKRVTNQNSKERLMSLRQLLDRESAKVQPNFNIMHSLRS